MIQTKSDLYFYLHEDRKRNGCDISHFRYLLGIISLRENVLAYRYLKCLRKCEYYTNTNGLFHNLLRRVYGFKMCRYSTKYHIHIPLNKTGYGLRIMHLSGGGWYFVECQ